MKRSVTVGLGMLLFLVLVYASVPAQSSVPGETAPSPAAASAPMQQTEPAATHTAPAGDFWSLLFVFVLASFIGMGVIARVSRLLHTPLMSLTNAISAIAVVGSIIVAGSDYPVEYRILGVIALFASMTNIVSGFLITERMLKMFKETRREGHS
jgi:H+-translocating NAD(P) transhydrogenase subunit alpha